MGKKFVPVAAGLLALVLLLAAIGLAPGRVPAMAAPAFQSAGTATPSAAAPGATATSSAPAGPAATPVAATASPVGDPNADNTLANVDLQAGFVMDPYLLPVVGKGERPAGELQQGCNGFIGKNPSAVINWSGQTDQLSFFVYSDGDPTLVLQGPDGSTVCNDDAGASTMQPLVAVKNPARGAYKVYVGAANQAEPALGFLGVTTWPLDAARLADLDLSPMLRHHARPQVQAPPQLDPRLLAANQAAIFGNATLQAGFKPVQTFAAGGGDIAAFRVEDKKLACAGFISAVPSYSFTWQGKGEALRVFFEGLKDTSLAVVTPGQDVLCNIDSAPGNANPAVDLPAPAEGAYKVYVASMAPNTVVAGRLTVTNDAKAGPAVLAPAGK